MLAVVVVSLGCLWAPTEIYMGAVLGQEVDGLLTLVKLLQVKEMS